MRLHRLPAKALFSLLVFLFAAPLAFALGQKQYVETTQHPGDFVLARSNHAAKLCIDSSDFPGVLRAASDLQADIARVTSITPEISHDASAPPASCVLIGTLGHSAVIDRLVREHKIDASSIAGKWESFLIQVVPHPFPGLSSALVIAGSDKRGAIYGIYDLSEQIGVSPWYWWADVPVPHRTALFVKPGKYIEGEPAVKYRGIFLNDEAPALTGWVKEKFGNYNHEFYTKVFELLLRLKANYLWPAMWNNAFNEDDPLNPKLADEYGIVMGTSHHEPMLRAQQEWKRHGKGPWDYSTNADFLRQFWTEGVERNKNYESIITLGMRGDGDLPMSEESNVALLEKIVADQRKILAEHVNPDLSKIPQDWALYKEVQAYYEKGMRVPDDVTLLWCDDNWGNIRRLPTPEERKRPGGAGIYYHVDYVGDPRSYKWLNTVPIAKIWEQMNLAHAYDANRIWIVNVGDLKPMEFPMEFFLNLARDPQRWPKENLGEYARLWAEREFGPAHAAEIADIISRYTKFNGRRKPELLEPGTYSLVNYREAESVFNDYKSVVDKAEKIYGQLPANQRDAFFELVLFPAKASAQVTELYIAVAKNRLYAAQGRASANDLAAQARALFDADASLSAEYNHTLAGGKWDHMMDQTHIGYTFWNEPPQNTMPAVKEIDLPEPAQMAVAIEGSPDAWPGSNASPALPRFDSFRRQREFIDVFNRGRAPFPFFATPSAPWIVLSSSRGQVTQEQRLWVAIDWTKAPRGAASGSVKISGPAGPDLTVAVNLLNPQEPSRASLNGFVESNGYVSIESVHFSAKVDSSSARWEKIDDLGRTLSSMSVFPVTSPSLAPPNSPHLEYRVYLFDPKQVQVEAILAPSLNFVPGRGLRYAISFDDQPPQIIDALAHNSVQDWSIAVEDSVKKSVSSHTLSGSGYHTLKFWMVDPGLVLQKLVLDLGGLKPSYLGPPESFFRRREL